MNKPLFDEQALNSPYLLLYLHTARSATYEPGKAQRSNVGHAQGDQFWFAARQFPAKNFKGKDLVSCI